MRILRPRAGHRGTLLRGTQPDGEADASEDPRRVRRGRRGASTGAEDRQKVVHQDKKAV